MRGRSTGTISIGPTRPIASPKLGGDRLLLWRQLEAEIAGGEFHHRRRFRGRVGRGDADPDQFRRRVPVPDRDAYRGRLAARNNQTPVRKAQHVDRRVPGPADIRSQEPAPCPERRQLAGKNDREQQWRQNRSRPRRQERLPKLPLVQTPREIDPFERLRTRANRPVDHRDRKSRFARARIRELQHGRHPRGDPLRRRQPPRLIQLGRQLDRLQSQPHGWPTPISPPSSRPGRNASTR